MFMSSYADLTQFVQTLAGAAGGTIEDGPLRDLANRAAEISRPRTDYEGAARRAGFLRRDDGSWHSQAKDASYGSAEDACLDWDIAAEEVHPTSFAAVPADLAEMLEADGADVARDFAGHHILVKEGGYARPSTAGRA